MQSISTKRAFAIVVLLAFFTAFSSCSKSECPNCPGSHFGPQPGGDTFEECNECRSFD